MSSSKDSGHVPGYAMCIYSGLFRDEVTLGQPLHRASEPGELTDMPLLRFFLQMTTVEGSYSGNMSLSCLSSYYAIVDH